MSRFSTGPSTTRGAPHDGGRPSGRAAVAPLDQQVEGDTEAAGLESRRGTPQPVVSAVRGMGVRSVSSGALPHRPRAYVAAPVAPATGLFQAINWAFDQAEDLTWGDLRIMVSDPGLVTRLSLLQRLKNRGVRIGTAEQAAGARSFRGMVIAFRPDAAMLVAAEALPGVRAVVAVAASNDQLREWVGIYAPQHLGGDVLPARPEVTAAVSVRSGQVLQPNV